MNDILKNYVRLYHGAIAHVQSVLAYSFLFGFLFFEFFGFSQFAPAAGQIGTTAVHKDSLAISEWANSVVGFKRGASDIANGWGVLASFGDSTEALGYAQGNSTDVISLGDSGFVTLSFPYPIMNGIGNDFAVFENSFSDDYLEFAFVEVSSDGINFIRFPSVSLTPTISQTPTFGFSNTELIHNLAGKYRQGYGTPFDLEDLVDSVGINLDSVRFVRIVDVIGTIDPAYATYDGLGNMINDPYPSDFAAGGFDLDGVAVMNANGIFASIKKENEFMFSVFPNPSAGNFVIETSLENYSIHIFDLSGNNVWSKENSSNQKIQIDIAINSGLYFVVVSAQNIFHQQLIVIQ